MSKFGGTATVTPLTIVLEFARSEQIQDAWGFRFEPQNYQMRTVGGGYTQALLGWDESLLRELEAVRQPDSDPAILQRVGERLRRFVAALGWDQIKDQILTACQQEQRVLVSIRSKAAELYALPWELLTLREGGQHIGEFEYVLLRYEWPETQTTPESPQPRHGPGRILLAWSAAQRGVPASDHISALAKACEAGFHPFVPSQDVLAHVSLGRLQDRLHAARTEGRPISILHLLCHGSRVGQSFGVLLNGEDGSQDAVAVDAGRMRQVLAPYANMLRLVVLIACDSGNSGRFGNELGSLAQALHGVGIAAVVASRYPLSVRGSNIVAQTLYRSLLVNLESQECALLAIRRQLSRDAMSRDWASVQLYARAADGVDGRPIVFRPYPGLSAFGREQQRFYFGREALTDKLWQRCAELCKTPNATRLLAVLGPSGSGKSSVARAGLIPLLERRPLSFFDQPPDEAAMQVAICKPGEHPLEALKAVLPMEEGAAPALVLVDQFEELYTLCQDAAERNAFVKRLLDLASQPGRKLLVVLTLRTDFIGETQRLHPALNRLLDEQGRLVTALSLDELRRSIAEPAARLGRPLDDATVDLLLSEAAGRDGALPLLEFALSQIWEGMLAGKQPAETLRAVGGVGGALAGKAQEIYDALSPSEKAMAKRALVRLVRLGEGTRDTRRRVPVSELCGHGETPVQVLSVLRNFASDSARLLTLSGDAAETIAEVTHESLFDCWSQLRAWIDESRADRGLHDRTLEAAKLWDKAGRPAGRLFRTPDLELLRGYKTRKPDELNELQEHFLAASIRQARSEAALRVLAVLAIIVALLVAALIQRQAKQAAVRAADEKNRLLLSTYYEKGRYLFIEQHKPDEALLWLFKAYREGSAEPNLAFLLRDAMRNIDRNYVVLFGDRDSDSFADESFSPDSRHIVTAGTDGSARIFDIETGRQLHKLKIGQQGLHSATYSASGRCIVTSSEDGAVQIWDAQSGKRLRELAPRFPDTRRALWSPNEQRIITFGREGTVRVWNSENGQLVRELAGHTGEVLGAAFSPSGEEILSWGHDGTRVYNADTGQLVAARADHAGGVRSAAWRPRGSAMIVSASATPAAASVFLPSATETAVKLVQKRGLEAPLGAWSAAFSPDGQRILTADWGSRSATIWDVTFETASITLAPHNEQVMEALYSPDGQLVATRSSAEVRVWDPTQGELLAKWDCARCYNLRFSPDSRFLAAIAPDGTTRVWSMSLNRFLRLLASGTRTEPPSQGLTANQIVTVDYFGQLRVWDGDSGQLVGGRKLPEHDVRAHTPDWLRIVTVDETQSGLRYWDLLKDTNRSLPSQDTILTRAAFTLDGRRLLTADHKEGVRIWDTESAEFQDNHAPAPKPKLEVPAETKAWSAAFSPDGSHFVLAQTDGNIAVYSLISNKRVCTSKGGHGARVKKSESDSAGTTWDVAFSPNGKQVATVSEDNTARLWNVQNCVAQREFLGHTDRAMHVGFSPDNARVITTGQDGSVRIWDAESGGLLSTLRYQDEKHSRAFISQDGRRMVTLPSPLLTPTFDSEERPRAEAHLWDLSTEQRKPEQLAKLLECYSPLKFESDTSAVIVPNEPAPKKCASFRWTLRPR